MDAILESLSELILSNVWLAPVLALLAGVLTSFTPCALSSVPLVVGYVGASGQKTTKRALSLSITFALGTAITFTALGIMATIAGTLIGNYSSWWYIALGVVMLLMSLQTMGIYEIIPSSYLLSRSKKKGYLGALIAGILGGVFSSPCSTPVLIALLAVVAGSDSFAFGIVLLLLYSIGHGILAVICGTSVGFVQKLSQNEKYGKASSVVKVIMGILIALIGFYMFYLAF